MREEEGFERTAGSATAKSLRDEAGRELARPAGGQ